MRGHLLFHSETGTEGGWYAFLDDRYIHGGNTGDPCPWGSEGCPVEIGQFHEHVSYEGLHRLRNGDYLTVRDTTGAVLFDGEVRLVRRTDVYRSETATIFGWWVNQEPDVGVDREIWARWFFDDLPATLRRRRPAP